MVVWLGLALALLLPVLAAAESPLLAWRRPVYIVAGFAGIVGLALLLVQPLLARSALPGLSRGRARLLHRWLGAALVAAVAVHVAGLWITSPPDVVDALLFASPTPFSLWGVIAMWAVLAAGLMALRRRRSRRWRQVHRGLAAVIVATTAAHALLIEGTMEPLTKAGLCALALLATAAAIATRQVRRRG